MSCSTSRRAAQLRRARLGLVAFVFLLSVFALAACGGSDDESSASGGEEPTAAEATAEGEPSDPPAKGFRDTTGTNAPAFGLEADEGQRMEAQEALAAYLQAVGAEEWDEACAYLTVSTRDAVKVAGRNPGKSCGDTLKLLSELGEKESKTAVYTGPVEVEALRIKEGGPAEEGAGFALFHGNNGTDYSIAMRKEGSEWKVTTISPTALG